MCNTSYIKMDLDEHEHEHEHERLNENLVDACYAGNLDAVKKIILPNCDLDWVIYIACINGYIEIAKYLHSLGANICGLFCRVCEASHFDIAQWIYDLDPKVLLNYYPYISQSNGCEDLIMACIVGNLPKAKSLYETATIVITHAMHNRILIIGCDLGHLLIAKWIHGLGANVNAHEDAAFQAACWNNQFEIVEWLISLNININAHADRAFRVSCERGNVETAKLLYSAGANIRALNSDAFCSVCRSIMNSYRFEYEYGSSDDPDIYKKDIQIITWLYSLDEMMLMDAMFDEDIHIASIAKELGLDLDEHTMNQLECIQRDMPLPTSDIIEDIVVEALFKYNRIDDLIRLDLSYVSYDIANGNVIINGTINKNQPKNARKI